MMSNINAIGSDSPPSVKPPMQPRVNLPEGSVQQAGNDNNTVIQSGTKPHTSETPPTSLAASDRKAQDAKALAETVDKLNQHLQGLSRTNLQFSIDDDAHQLVVKVMDVEKDEVIRQIPAKEALKLAAFFKEKADREARQMERAAGLAPGAASPEGLLLDTTI